MFKNYWELCKPNVVALMLMTALVGMLLSQPGKPTAYFPMIWGLIGIGLAASAAAVFNHLADKQIDSMMARTRGRPLPSQKISPKKARLFAGLLAGSSLLILGLAVNLTTAYLTLFGIIGYAVLYTRFLKKMTPQNIVIGGATGAVPPLLGWTSMTGSIEPAAWSLVMIIFIWTPPHFWALAIHRYQDYLKAKIPMLPVTHGIAFTKLCILLYTILLIPCSLIPFIIHLSGGIYLITALVLGFYFLKLAWKLYLEKEPSKTANLLFKYSITYLFFLFMGLLLDHYLI